ncbi:hypothetical protein OSB04_003867 [Centaurea solstitialis]|uniref:Uncharacterized protein n=1 Tax=Centaurea solstitialis TaxID=347529 RepID=A0AA38U870_9ASTR|nr:hypothetical protein OSB04_003867 [Centaurea solstitialis]
MMINHHHHHGPSSPSSSSSSSSCGSSVVTSEGTSHIDTLNPNQSTTTLTGLCFLFRRKLPSTNTDPHCRPLMLFELFCHRPSLAGIGMAPVPTVHTVVHDRYLTGSGEGRYPHTDEKKACIPSSPNNSTSPPILF